MRQAQVLLQATKHSKNQMMLCWVDTGYQSSLRLPAVMARLFFFVLLFPLLYSSVTGLRRSDFPPSFLFGAGTSAYQVRAVR